LQIDLISNIEFLKLDFLDVFELDVFEKFEYLIKISKIQDFNIKQIQLQISRLSKNTQVNN